MKVAHSVDTPGRGFDLQGRLQQVATMLALLCYNYHQQQLILLSLKKGSNTIYNLYQF